MEPVLKHSLSPIGYFSCPQKNPVESPRQGSEAPGSQGMLKLDATFSEQALRDLESFDYIWLLYIFHQNTEWKEMVRPPRGANKKRGVFATRSPYRPNFIGMSCVKLLEVRDSNLLIGDHDLLDGTPVVDVKPYLSYCDSRPQASQGWLGEIPQYRVDCHPDVLKPLSWLSEQLQLDLALIIENQLSYDPTNKKIKRVRAEGDCFVYSFRTWRFRFRLSHAHRIEVLQILSGYNEQEITEEKDPYQDKEIHRRFIKKFCS